MNPSPTRRFPELAPAASADGRMSFGSVVRRAHAAGSLVVQPRLGFSDPWQMRQGLLETRAARARTVGTLTVDSYTRLGNLAEVQRNLAAGAELNGYPIATHSRAVTSSMLADVAGPDFPVQVRHGSATPQHIVRSMLLSGLDATEGGPVSYCLPYGRVPLQASLANWRESCRLLADRSGAERAHLETFGGCMLGQLCPPGLLVALSVLEALFFCQQGVHSVSLSYAQQTNGEQDREAVAALRRLAAQLIPTPDWHVVVYAYMGVYPRTAGGALLLLADAARLATDTGSERLIVKTVAEAHRIPTVAENVQALELAAAVSAARRAATAGPAEPTGCADSEIYLEAATLIEHVLSLSDDVGRGLITAFRTGLLDIPYCLHPDNAGLSDSFLDSTGRLRWCRTGRMPIRPASLPLARATSTQLLGALNFLADRYDRAAAEPATAAELLALPRLPAEHLIGASS